MAGTSNNVKSYTRRAEFNDNTASHAFMVEELSHEKSGPDTKILYKRAVVYWGVGGALFVVFLFFATELYFLQSIRLANIAFSIAFIGLLLFVTLSGIAFLTIFDLGKANYNSSEKRRQGKTRSNNHPAVFAE